MFFIFSSLILASLVFDFTALCVATVIFTTFDFDSLVGVTTEFKEGCFGLYSFFFRTCFCSTELSLDQAFEQSVLFFV